MLTKLVLALTVAIQTTNHHVPRSTARTYARWVAQESRAHHLDPWVFLAIVRRETQWVPAAIRHENDGTCSVGLGQINVPCVPQRVAPLIDPHRNIQRMGQFLEQLKTTCRVNCKNLGWLRGYNPRSLDYFEAVRDSVLTYDAHDSQPALQRVPTRMHPSRVLRQASP